MGRSLHRLERQPEIGQTKKREEVMPMKYQPHDYQKRAMTEMVNASEKALFLEMGLG